MTLERRLGAVERRMDIVAGPLAHFSDADLLAALEWIGTALGEFASKTLAREDGEEARLKAFYERPDITRCLDLEEGWRWPYQRAHALAWERGHPSPRSAATPEALRRKIDTALAAMPRAL